MRGTPIIYFKSLTRPIYIMGVSRELFYGNMGLAVFIAYSSHFAVWVDIFAFVLAILGYAIGLLLTRLDSQMVTIFKRHIHYARYYAPISGLQSTRPIVKPSVPFYEGKRGLV